MLSHFLIDKSKSKVDHEKLTKSQYLQRLLIFSKLQIFDLKNKELSWTSICEGPYFLVLPNWTVFLWCYFALIGAENVWPRSNAAIATQSYHYEFRLHFAQSKCTLRRPNTCSLIMMVPAKWFLMVF